METINLWQMIFTAMTAIAAVMAAILANKIGKKQIDITDFVEIFLHPQQVTYKQENSEIISWNLLVKNASSYPIYLSNSVFNGIKHDIGSSVIPNNPDSWYAIPIPDNIQKAGEFSILIEFEDYLGLKYQAESFGVFDGRWWQVRSKKRIEIK